MEKDAETAAAKKAATSENPASLRRLQAAQKQAAAPYVVLSGSVRHCHLSWHGQACMVPCELVALAAATAWVVERRTAARSCYALCCLCSW